AATKSRDPSQYGPSPRQRRSSGRASLAAPLRPERHAPVVGAPAGGAVWPLHRLPLNPACAPALRLRRTPGAALVIRALAFGEVGVVAHAAALSSTSSGTFARTNASARSGQTELPQSLICVVFV